MSVDEQAKPRWKKWADALVLVLLLALTFAARCHNWSDVFHHRGVFFVDGDCYSRMTRAKMVSEGQWIIRHHDFENWPEGVTPHTTALLDWMVVGLKPVMDAACKIGGTRLTEYRMQTLDLAGAFISPLLGVLTAAWLWWWAGRMRLPFRVAMMLMFALSPIAVHGTVLGRPDHQSLLMLLLAVALGCELRLMRSDEDAKNIRRGWSIAAGCAWGVALWVSLYEPLLLLVPVVIARLLRERKSILAAGRREEWFALLGCVVLGFVMDGWRAEVPGPELRENFARWSAGIGELRHLNPTGALLWEWLGLLIVAAPVLLCLAGLRDRRAFAVLGGLLLLLGLTVWQLRWGYFLLLAYVMSLPWMLPAFRSTRMAWIAFVVGFAPICVAWSRMLHPPESVAEDRARKQFSQFRFRSIALKMSAGPRTGFIAPWWVSPQIAYWSGLPGVAGTSHQSLSGIVDTARFYLATNDAKAAEILRRRKVGWVVADNNSSDVAHPDRLLAVTNSEIVLGVRAAEEPLALILADYPRRAPKFLSEIRPEELGLVIHLSPKDRDTTGNEGLKIYATQMHRLYRVLPELP